MKHNGDRKNNNDNQWKLNKPPRKHFWRRNNVTEQLTVDNWQKPKCKGSHGGMLKRSSGEEEKDTSVLSSHYHLVLLREKKRAVINLNTCTSTTVAEWCGFQQSVMTVFINIHEKEKTHDDLTGVKTCVNNAQWKIKIKQTLNKL